MTKPTNVKIHCSPTIKNILCEALEKYASSGQRNPDGTIHYIKKTELLGIIDNIEQQYTQTSSGFSIDGDSISHLESAVSFHYDHIQQQLRTSVAQQKSLLINALHGMPVDDGKLDDALRKDNLI